MFRQDWARPRPSTNWLLRPAVAESVSRSPSRQGQQLAGQACPEQPVCLFGPGQGYYRPWPGENFRPGQIRRAFRRVMAGLGRLFRLQKAPIEGSLSPDSGRNPGLGLLEQMARKVHERHREILLEDLAQTRRLWAAAGSLAVTDDSQTTANRLIWEPSYERNSKATRNLASDKRFSHQAWLFPDHAGVGQQAGRQQGNRLSAHRSPRRKRPASKVASQGTLFGA